MIKKNDLKMLYTEKQPEAYTAYYRIPLTTVQDQEESQQCSV